MKRVIYLYVFFKALQILFLIYCSLQEYGDAGVLNDQSLVVYDTGGSYGAGQDTALSEGLIHSLL